MIQEITFTHCGDWLELAIPDSMAKRLGLRAGDRVYAIKTDAGIRLTRDQPDSMRVLDAAGRISDRYQNALRELAK